MHECNQREHSVYFNETMNFLKPLGDKVFMINSIHGILNCSSKTYKTVGTNRSFSGWKAAGQAWIN